MELAMRNALGIALAVSMIFSAMPVLADLSTDTVRDLSIENANATVLANGEVQLRFVLTNDSPEAVIVTGVSSPFAQSGEIVGASHHGAAFPISNLIVQPDEEIDFSTSHLRVRLTGIADPKDVLAFYVLLDDGAVSGEAHVH